MPQLKIPLTAPDGKTCEHCMYWSSVKAQQYVLTMQGPAPTSDIPAEQRLETLAKMPHFHGSFCWQEPNWQIKPADHFCGQFKGRG